jgi:putative pre-16S rRNA nuclease
MVDGVSVSETVPSGPKQRGSGRILAIDLGERRMGLAISDPLGLTAQGLPTIERRNRRQDMNYLKSLARRHDVSVVIVGNPMNMDGTAGPQSAAASAFASKLEKHLQLQVKLWDERLTSVEANRRLRESGLTPQERAKSVDQVAAVLLLENFMEAHRRITPFDASGIE